MDLKKTLLQLSDVTHGRISNAQTFSDFLAYAALRLSTRTDPVHYKERAEQLQRLGSNYKEPELQEFLSALTVICETVKHNVDVGDWADLFADAYMDVRARNENLKQDFTPKGVAALMSRLAFLDNCSLPENGYFTLSDHACGSGTLLLNSAEHLNLLGFNPSSQLAIQAVDLDIRCVHMAYLNLSLYGIPAVVIRGNTITVEEYDRWYTPTYLLGRWIWKEPMLFGNGGATDNEHLKLLDDPIYRAIKLLFQQKQPPSETEQDGHEHNNVP